MNKTTLFERSILFSLMVAIPFQQYVPTIGGISLPFILMGMGATYLLVWRMNTVQRICLHPVFLAGFAFVMVGMLLELAHYSFGFSEVGRIFFMLLGGIILASLCRDEKALKVSLYGILTGATLVALVLIFSSYDTLAAAQSTDYREASRVRASFGRGGMRTENLNILGFVMAQGAIIGLGFAFNAKVTYIKFLFWAITLCCFIGTFMPMSRSALLILFITGGVIVYAKGLLNPKAIFGCLILVLTVGAFVPDVVWKRFTIATDKTSTGRSEDSRLDLYALGVTELPEVILTGVGKNNFYGSWGKTRGFHGKGTHNSVTQIAYYWGLAGVIGLGAIIWQVYRSLPKIYGWDPLRLGILGLSLSMLCRSMLMHQLYDKRISIVLGLVTGASVWIWPRDPVRKMSFQRATPCPSRPKALVGGQGLGPKPRRTKRVRRIG